MPTETLSTHDRLLEAAGPVFAEHGFRGATVRQICRAAKANVGAVNYHFGDKDHLYRAVLRFAFEQMNARNPTPFAWPAETPVAVKLREFVRAFLGRLMSAGDSWHGQLLARELAEPTGALREVAHDHMQPKMMTLDGIIADACPELSAEQRHLHVLSLIGQCVLFRHARPVLDVLYGPESFSHDQIPTLTEHIVCVFLRGLGLDPEAE